MKIARRFTKSFHYGQKGFTLVELLIVIAILGILAAVAIPNLVSFIGTGEEQALATEQDVIQTAMIAVLAANSIIAVDVQAGTTDLTGLPRGTGDVDLSTPTAGDGDFDDFLVKIDASQTKYTYSWLTNGVVTVIATP